MNSLLKDRIRTAQGQDRDCTHLLGIAEERVQLQQKLIDSLKKIIDGAEKALNKIKKVCEKILAAVQKYYQY